MNAKRVVDSPSPSPVRPPAARLPPPPSAARSSSAALRRHPSAKMFGLFGGGPPARTTQAQLVQHLMSQGLLRTPRVIDAFRHVDRGAYCNADFLSAPGEAYEDRPLPIGNGQTISAPHMHAMCCEALEPSLRPGARVLDVGSGSGYLVSVLAKVVGPGGYVLGVEKEPDLAARSVYTISRANPEVLFSTGRSGAAGDGEAPGSPRDGGAMGADAALSPTAAAASSYASSGPRGRGGVRVAHGNVLDPEGPLKGEQPFDAIHVGAAADALHEPLLKALAPGGRMVVPVGARYGAQELTLVEKGPAAEGGRVTTRRITAVQYVPLTKPGEADDGLTAAEARRYARLVRAQQQEEEQGPGPQEQHGQHHHHHRHHHDGGGHRRHGDDEEM